MEMNNFIEIVTKELSFLNIKTSFLLFFDLSFNKEFETIDLLVEDLFLFEKNLSDHGFIKLKNRIWIKYFSEIQNWIKFNLFNNLNYLTGIEYKTLLESSYKYKNSSIKFISHYHAIIYIFTISFFLNKKFNDNYIKFLNKNIKLINIKSFKFENNNLNIYNSLKYFYKYKENKISKKEYFDICTKRNIFFKFNITIFKILIRPIKYFLRVINKKIIIFIGPDGSGKSSLIKELSKLENFSVRYMGPSQYKYEKNNLLRIKISNLDYLRTYTKKKTIKGKFYRFSYFLFLYIDCIYRYFSYYLNNSSEIILIDRFVIDHFVRHPNFIRKILFVNLFPYPKHIFLMRGDSKAISTRKRNLTKNEIDSQYFLYEKVLQEKYPKRNEIKTTNQKIEDSIKEILNSLHDESILPIN